MKQFDSICQKIEILSTDQKSNIKILPNFENYSKFRTTEHSLPHWKEKMDRTLWFNKK